MSWHGHSDAEIIHTNRKERKQGFYDHGTKAYDKLSVAADNDPRPFKSNSPSMRLDRLNDRKLGNHEVSESQQKEFNNENRAVAQAKSAAALGLKYINTNRRAPEGGPAK